MRLLSSAVLLALAGAPVAAQEVPALVSHEYDLSFRISAPPDWEIVRDRGAARWAAISRLSGSGDTFYENVNVLTEGIPTPTPLPLYLRDQLAVLRRDFGAVTVVDSADRTIAGHDGLRLVYELTSQGRDLRVVSYFFLVSDRAYVLTCTAEAARFDEYLPIFEAMVRTFAL